MRSVRRALDEIRRGENIDLYIATPLALLVAVLGVFGVTSSELISALTLVILSLLANSLLTSRHEVKDLSRQLTQSSSSVLLKDWIDSDFQKDLEAAQELWLVGVSLTTIIRIHYSEIERKVRAGCSVKVLLVHPDGPAVEMAEMRAYGRPNVERARNEIRNTLLDLCELGKDARREMQIRTVQHPLGHGVIAKDPGTALGVMYVQNYPFNTEGGSRPKLVLKASDGFWYEFYKQEMYNLWSLGVEWSCTEAAT